MSNDSNTAVLEPPTTTTTLAPPTLEIDRADWGDMDAVQQIIRSSASWYEDIVSAQDLAEHYVDEEWARDNFQRREFYVGKLDDEVAGTISLQEVGEDHLYLGYVYLHTDHVGNGFGRVLLDFARDEARRRGRKSLVLIAHPEADWACRAYQKYGFRIVAEEREDVLSWENGWLDSYYEEGFQLYQYRV